MATRRQTKERTRKRLLSSAILLFSRKGIDRPSLDEICHEAGVTRGAFYVHFKDRDDLLAAVMDDVGRAFLESFFGGAGGTLPLASAFASAMESGTYPLTRRGGVRPHQLLDACARSKLIRQRYTTLVRDAIERLRERMSAEQAAGALREDLDAGAVSVLLLMLAIGAHTMVDLDLELDPPSLLGTLGALLYPRA
jgi:AcrR family transcriptional regulator